MQQRVRFRGAVAVAGTWVGKKLLDRNSQESFRRIVLVLLLLTGCVMIGKARKSG